MRGRDLVMLSEGQWEASKKIAWKGDKHQTSNAHRDSMIKSAQWADSMKIVGYVFFSSHSFNKEWYNP